MGRRVLEVRVCSCPKRDKEKEEKECQKDGHELLPLSGKKRKVEKSSTDLTEYKLSLKVIGKETYYKLLQCAVELTKSSAYTHGPSAEPVFKKALAELNALSKFDVMKSICDLLYLLCRKQGTLDIIYQCTFFINGIHSNFYLFSISFIPYMFNAVVSFCVRLVRFCVCQKWHSSFTLFHVLLDVQCECAKPLDYFF